jgi:2-methylisocitrate lyase-like PEP mutase family enzyme
MTSGLTTRALRFRELTEAGRLLLPNAWDAASARVFEEAGFPAIGTTSAGIAYAEGYQDAEHIHRDTMVRAIAKIASALSIPVSADIEGGYGPSARDVAATVDAVLDAGAVGVNLEDANHYGGTTPLLSVDEQCERIAAAREIANGRGVSLVINARTDTFLLQLGADLDERVAITVERGTRYLRAGADLVFVPMLVDTSVITRLVSRLEGPISVMALPGAPSATDLFAAGVARVSIGQMGMLAALGTLKNIALELIQHGTWRSIEASFYGFGEADALFARRSLEARPLGAGSA